MTRQELERIESILKENGYRKGGKPMHCNSDYYWWKSFGKGDNAYEEGRSLYKVLLNVYDWTKYWDRDPMLRKCNKCASITATVSVSRTIDEPAITLNFDLGERGLDLLGIEDRAYCFYQYVNDYFKVNKKEIHGQSDE